MCGTHILLAGKNTEGILAYSPVLNKKKRILRLSGSSEHCVILKTTTNDLFYLSQKNIYASSCLNYNHWYLVGHYEAYLDEPLNEPVQINDCFYFMMQNPACFKFNFKELKAEVLYPYP